MHNKIAAWAVATIAAAGMTAVHGHHSISMFDVAKPVWIKGTVVSYTPVNPHAMLALEEKTADGQVKRWILEGPTLQRLKRMGVGADFLKAGDAIEVCGFAFREPPPNGSARPALHAHVLVMRDGKMRFFGPYGKLTNCIRQDDTTHTWLEFLDRDPLARIAWCTSHNVAARPSDPSQKKASIAGQLGDSFVAEVDARMANPCGRS